MGYQIFFQPPYDIFAITALFALGVSLLEIVMFMFGFSFSKMIGADHDFDVDLDHDFDLDLDLSIDGLEADGSVNLFNLGDVPFLVILLSFTTFFSFLGLGGHWVVSNMGLEISNLVAVPAATSISALLTYSVTKWWKKVFPNSESYAVSERSLIGRVGEINLGTATKKNAVEVAIYDEHNSKHYVMAKVATNNVELKQGQKVILVHKEKSGNYLMLPYFLSVVEEKIENNLTQEKNAML